MTTSPRPHYRDRVLTRVASDYGSPLSPAPPSSPVPNEYRRAVSLFPPTGTHPGEIAGDRRLGAEGEAQHDKADAQRDVAENEAEAEKARAEAEVHEARQRANE